MTNSNTFELIVNASSPADLLIHLKDLKNGVIGNTWKKVEVAEDERLLKILLSLLEYPSSTKDVNESMALDLLSETAVIIGALANVGHLTLQPLLLSFTPSSLLTLIISLTTSSPAQIPEKQLERILPHLLRALRNILVSTADMIWGHMWGVGAERKVVGTGLVGEQEIADTKGKQAVGKGWKGEASKALSLVFEPNNLSTLLSLLDTHSDPQILLPLYQLLSRLVALPSHRSALLSYAPDPSTSTVELPFIIQHLLNTVIWLTPSSGGSFYTTRKPNTKLIEASLDLLAALVKGQPSLSIAIRSWNLYDITRNVEEEDGARRSEFIGRLLELVSSGPANTRIAAASCLTNVIKADKGIRPTDRLRSTAINYQLLDEIIKLLQSEGMEERIKLCFILAALVSDDAALQKAASEKDCPSRLIGILISVFQEEEKGEIGSDLASRSKEATFLALASLAMQHDPTRTLISDHSPPVLPYLFKALSSPSYGVRAAGCQLARALSRTVSLLRTSLVDSGVGEEIIRLLRREVEASKEIALTEEEISDRIWTVEVAATATICNLITDFSPLKTVLLREGGLELLCDLTRSPYEPLALNAMWAIKNLTYHAMEATKIMVTTTLGWDRLRALSTPSTIQSLRIQALEITQNLFADSSVPEITRAVENFGETELFDSIIQASRESQDADLRIPALYVLSNIALGNEKIRNSIVGRVEILEILSTSLNSPNDSIKIPTLRTLRHLIESNSNSKNPNPNHRSKPRQQMIDIFQPYQLKYRLKELVENSLNVSVKEQSIGLLDVLERERGNGGNGGTSSGGR